MQHLQAAPKELYTVDFTQEQPQGTLSRRQHINKTGLTFAKAKALVKKYHFRESGTWRTPDLTVTRQSDGQSKYFKTPADFFSAANETTILGSLKGKFMKNEIKALYKKDPKLARKTAAALGFKIKTTKKISAAAITLTFKVPAALQKKILKSIEGYKVTAGNEQKLVYAVMNNWLKNFPC